MAYEIDYVKNFTGGENNWSAPDNLIDGEMILCDNVELMGRGGFSKRSGITPYILVNNVGEDPTYLYIIYTMKYSTSSTSDYILAICHNESTGKDYIVKIIPEVSNTIVYTFSDDIQPFGLYPPAHAIYKHKLYLLAGARFFVYDGTTVSEVTNANADSNLSTIKNCHCIIQRGERLFAANNDYLYYSERGDPTYWKTTSILYIDTDESDSVEALYEYNDSLLVFRKNSVYVWKGYDLTSEVTFYRLRTHTGTVSGKSIQQVGNSVYFLGLDGIYALYTTDKDTVSTVKISNNISSKLKAVQDKVTWWSYVEVSSIFYDSKYIIRIYDTIFVYNTNVNVENGGAWSTYSFSKTLSTVSDVLLPYNLFVYENKLCFHCKNTIYKFIDNTYKDSAYVNGQLVEAPINLHVKLRPLAQNEYVNLKKYRKGYIVMQQYMDKQSSCTVKANVDYFETSATMSPDEALIYDNDGRSWDNNVWDFTDVITRSFPIKATGKRLLIDISDNTINNTITIYGVGVEYKVKKPDRG